jgi:hypothetical protein
MNGFASAPFIVHRSPFIVRDHAFRTHLHAPSGLQPPAGLSAGGGGAVPRGVRGAAGDERGAVDDGRGAAAGGGAGAGAAARSSTCGRSAAALACRPARARARRRGAGGGGLAGVRAGGAAEGAGLAAPQHALPHRRVRAAAHRATGAAAGGTAGGRLLRQRRAVDRQRGARGVARAGGVRQEDLRRRPAFRHALPRRPHHRGRAGGGGGADLAEHVSHPAGPLRRPPRHHAHLPGLGGGRGAGQHFLLHHHRHAAAATAARRPLAAGPARPHPRTLQGLAAARRDRRALARARARGAAPRLACEVHREVRLRRFARVQEPAGLHSHRQRR